MEDKKKILIVEDEFCLAEIIKERIHFWGYKALIAENGQDAIEILENVNIDLVLMDIIMPVMDGWEATQRIKGHKKWQDLPVVFLTARSRHFDRIKANEVGGSDYIAKPFETEDLKAVLKRWLP